MFLVTNIFDFAFNVKKEKSFDWFWNRVYVMFMHNLIEQYILCRSFYEDCKLKKELEPEYLGQIPVTLKW